MDSPFSPITIGTLLDLYVLSISIAFCVGSSLMFVTAVVANVFVCLVDISVVVMFFVVVGVAVDDVVIVVVVVVAVFVVVTLVVVATVVLIVVVGVVVSVEAFVESVTLKCIDNPTANPIVETNKIIDSIHHFFFVNFRMDISRLEG